MDETCTSFCPFVMKRGDMDEACTSFCPFIMKKGDVDEVCIPFRTRFALLSVPL